MSQKWKPIDYVSLRQMSFAARCFTAPCHRARSRLLSPSYNPCSPVRCLPRPYSTTESRWRVNKFQDELARTKAAKVYEEIAIEQQRSSKENDSEGEKTQRPEATNTKKTRQQPTWGPDMWADSPLHSRPGIIRSLELRELKEPPGLIFDPLTNSLSVSPSFRRHLYYREPTHHKAKPWIGKAMLQRATAWLELDFLDRNRVIRPEKTSNRTTKRHLGMVAAYPMLISGTTNRVQKYRYDPAFVWWARALAPTLPERMFGHIDGIVSDDAFVYMEHHSSFVKDHTGRLLGCVWVAVNASFSVAMRTCDDLAIGKTPNPEWDILTPVLTNFCAWFRAEYHGQKEVPKKSEMTSVTNRRHDLPKLRDMIPPGHDIPVLLAFRHQYLLFIWKGGIDGKLVAQYQGHWLPLHEVGPKPDFDHQTNKLQQGHLRRGAAADTLPKASGGKSQRSVGDDTFVLRPEDFYTRSNKYEPDIFDPEYFAALLHGKGAEETRTKGIKAGPMTKEKYLPGERRASAKDS